MVKLEQVADKMHPAAKRQTPPLAGGIMALAVMAAGVVMMSGAPSGPFSGGMGGALSAFMVVWVIFGLVGAAAAFYNAFSSRGLPMYEIDLDSGGTAVGDQRFCPNCGKSIRAAASFCEHCGQSIQ